jgi:hypothetical protein
MSRAPDYRNHAYEARQYAAHLSSAPEKAMWLQIAKEWDRMAEEASGNQGAELAQQSGAIGPKEPQTKG